MRWRSKAGIVTVRKLLTVLSVIGLLGVLFGIGTLKTIDTVRRSQVERTVEALNAALAKYRSLGGAEEPLIGKNDAAHHRRVLQALTAGVVTPDGVKHDLLTKGRDAALADCRSVGSGDSFWFVSSEPRPTPPIFQHAPVRAETETGKRQRVQYLTRSLEPVTYAYEGLPAWAEGTRGGEISFMADTAQEAIIRVAATNSLGTAHWSTVLAVVWAPPALTSASHATAFVGAPFQYTITGSNNTTSAQAENLPAGLSLRKNVIQGVPTVAGSYDVALTLHNARGQTTARLVLSVRATPPVLRTPATLEWPIYHYSTAQVRLENGPNAAVTVTGLPPGLEFDEKSCSIRGMATRLGENSVVLEARNGSGSDRRTMRLVVVPSPTCNDKGKPSLSAGFRQTPAGYQWAGKGHAQIDFEDNAARDIIGLTVATSQPVSGVVFYSTDMQTWQPVARLNITPGRNFYVLPEVGNVAHWRLELAQDSTEIATLQYVGWHEQVLLEPKPAVQAGKVVYTRSRNLPLSYRVLASGSPQRYSATNLPAGLSLDAATGQLMGSASELGVFGINVTAINRSGAGYGQVVLEVRP